MTCSACCVSVALAAATFTFVMPARADEDTCWQMIVAALQASARSPHAHFISYGERALVLQDGKTLQRSSADVTYRDDGIAYISDTRWAIPFVTARLEPGPPVLGPYGRMRRQWLSLGNDRTDLPVIADVHNPAHETCQDMGIVRIDGLNSEHLVVAADHPNSAGLHEIWIDPTTSGITRLVVRGPLMFYVDNEYRSDLTNFVVDVEHINGYSVVRRVTWEYRERYYSQWSNIAAEYDFNNYSFSDAPPPQSVSAWGSTR